jgi:hypothetical protein
MSQLQEDLDDLYRIVMDDVDSYLLNQLHMNRRTWTLIRDTNVVIGMQFGLKFDNEGRITYGWPY